ncbi:MAG: hypothetical protein R2795_24145 [Saprospiraceae bacterium]
MWIHRSYTVFEGFGRTPSNGMIYIVDSTCVVFDTPVTTKTTTRLLDYLTQERGLQVRALVVNHFHEDCMAGIDSFHSRGIVSYSSKATARRAKTEGLTIPQKRLARKTPSR